MHTWLDRHPAAGDAGVAVVLLLFCLSTFVGGERDAGVVDVVFTVLLCAPLAVRRRAPVATFAAVMVLCAAELLLVDSFLAANAAALIALYTLVVYAPRPLAAAGVGVALAGTVPFALHFDDLSRSSETLAWVVLTVHLLLAALLGDRMRAERERRAAAAASEERARIARELHDVVAHSLSVVIAQADGGRYAAEHDPAAATDALRTIARSAREAQGRCAARWASSAPRRPRRCSPSPASARSGRSSSAPARRAWPSASTSGATRARSRRRPA